MSADRKRGYKNVGKDEHDFRRKRGEEQVQLRKNRKDEILAVRRNLQTGTENEAQVMQQPEIDNKIVEIADDLSSDNDTLRLRGVQLADKLWRQAFPPIDELISSGIVNNCVELIQKSDNKDLLLFSTCVIALAAVANKDIIIQSEAGPSLIKMLESPHPQLVERSCWAIGNFMDDHSPNRDRFLGMGLITSLVYLSDIHAENLPVLRKLSWAISTLLQKCGEYPSFAAFIRCITVLARLIAFEDREVLENTCTGFFNVCSGFYDNIKEVIKMGVLPRLITLLDYEHASVIIPSLKVIGCIASGSEAQTALVIQSGVIPKVMKLLTNQNRKIVKKAVAVITDISAGGTLDQILYIMKSGAVPMLLKITDTGSLSSRREAIWTIRNIIVGGTMDHIMTLRDLGLFPLLYRCLNISCFSMVQDALSVIESLLVRATIFKQSIEMSTFLEEVGCLEKIEALVYCENELISFKSKKIIERYFDDGKKNSLEEETSEPMDFDVAGYGNMEF